MNYVDFYFPAAKLSIFFESRNTSLIAAIAAMGGSFGDYA